MKKFLALMALLLCFTVLFVACEEERPTEPVTEPNTQAPCTHKYDNDCDATCNLCGETRTPAAHVEVELKAVAPTCTQDGLTAGKQCSVCGKITVPREVDPATGHDVEEIKGKAPTCTETGLTDGEKCKVCGKETVAQKVIYATGHKLVEIEGKEPTCEESGLTAGKKCSVCDEIIQAQEEIAPLGHVGVITDALEPTCTEEGHTGVTVCILCFEVLDEGEVIPATGHGDAVAFDEIPATCTTPGYTSGTKCSVCGEVLTAATKVEATGHKEVTVNGKAPTCTETGLTEGKKCSVCGEVTVAQKVIPAAHGENVPMEDVEATCTTIGYTGGMKCSVCGKVTVPQTVVPAGHIYDADCDDDCNRCGYVRPIVADHSFKFGRCENCGIEDPAYAGLAMTMYDATNIPFDEEKGLYYMMDSNPKSNISRDGYSWNRPNDWTLAPGSEGNYGKGSGYTENKPIRIVSDVEGLLELKMFGWVKFGDMTLDTFGIFTDSLDSVDDIYWNNTVDAMPNHLDLYNGTGLWANAGISNDIISALKAPNARRFCIAARTSTTLWSDIRNQPGVHTFYIVAKMTDGQLIVVTDFKIEIVNHEHTYPAEGTTGVGVVTPATCTSDGYTTVNCSVDAHGCTSTVRINAVPALGHNPSSEWTFVDGTHFHQCANPGCSVRFDEGTCSGSGTHCDVCGSLYNCNHKYVVDLDGSVKCVNGCGAVKHKAPDHFWTGADLYENYDEGKMGGVFKPTLQDDGSALFTGAHGADGSTNTISLKIDDKKGKYVGIVYKANVNHEIWWCHHNSSEDGPGLHTPLDVSSTDGSWGIKAGILKNHMHGWNQVRLNITTNSSLRMEIAYIALFNDFSDWVAYVNDADTYQIPQVVETGAKHAWDEGVVVKESTCTEAGSITHKCVACDATATVALPLKAHTFGGNEEIVPSTCIQKGTKTWSCTVCGHEVVEELELAPHTEATIPAVAPTCTETGLTAGTKCSVCDKVLSAPTEVPAAGHTYDNACDAYCNVCGRHRKVSAHVDADANGICDECGILQGTVKEWPLAIGNGFTSTPDFIPGTSVQDPGVDTYYYIYTANADGVFELYTRDADVTFYDAEGTLMETPSALREGDVIYLFVMSAKPDFTDYSSVTFEINVHTAGTQKNPFELTLGEVITTPEFIPGTSVQNPGVDSYWYIYTAQTEGRLMFAVNDAFVAIIDADGIWHEDYLDVAEGDVVYLQVMSTKEIGDDSPVSFIANVYSEGTRQNPIVFDGANGSMTTPEFVDVEEFWYVYTAQFDCTISLINGYYDYSVARAYDADGNDIGDNGIELHEGDVVYIRVTTTRKDEYKTAPVEFGIIYACRHLDTEVLPAVEATCTSTGLTEGLKCTACGEILTAQEEISMIPHTEVAIEDVSATCTTDGHTGGKQCSVCGTVTEEPTVVPAAHTPVEIEDVEATCGDAGHTGGTKCSVCDAVIEEPTVIPATGNHDYVSTAKKDATCSENGYEQFKCSVCNDIKTDVIEKLPHTEVDIEDVDATCTADGHTGGTKCSVCETVLTQSTVVPAKGHSYEETSRVDATCTAAGSVTSTCTVCQDVKTEALAQLPHTEVDVEAVAPTCTDTGLTAGKKCSVCGTFTVAQTEVAALGHTYVSDCATECTRCHETREAIAEHNWDNAESCTPTCTLCGFVKEGTHSIKYGKCELCGDTDPAYAGIAMSLQDAVDIPFGKSEANKDLFYMLEAEPKDNITRDGFSWDEMIAWQLGAGSNGGDHVKNVKNENTGITYTNNYRIKIASNSEILNLKLFGWTKFGDMALDTYGVFVDKITSADQILFNDSQGVAANYLDIYNGTGVLAGANMSGDIINAFKAPNARRFCIAFYHTTALWNSLKAQPGEHTVYIVAKMADGQLIVVNDFAIEIVAHDHTFPAEGSENVKGTVVAPTCTSAGYTVANCLVDALGCKATKNINEKPAMGHTASDTWTFNSGKHYHECINGCGEKFDEAECSGANGSTCDTCGGKYACAHEYVVNAENGAFMCKNGCGSVKYAAPTEFWTGEDLVAEWNSAGFGNYKPTLQKDGSALISGAPADVNGGSHTLSLTVASKQGKYIMIVYKSNQNHRIWWINWNTAGGAAAHEQLELEASSGWAVKAGLGKRNDHTIGRADVRFNIDGNADIRTEIAYIALFDDWSAYLAYVNDSDTYKLPETIFD